VATPASPLYSDTSLTNGTTYYYVVSAVSSVGESANSAQVSATPSPPPPTTFGTWQNVTPSGVDLVNSLSCGNYGTETVQADPAHPSHLYSQFHCQGIWKSTDYGATWSGPINTGTNGTLVADCAGGIAISPTSVAAVPTIYQTCIRGSAIGIWRSVDGGVNWARQVVAATTRQDYYPPHFDPYDQNHLVTTAHEFDSVIESFDGGLTWSSVPLNSGMLLNGGSAAIFFINTGNATTTRGTWLYIGDGSGSGVRGGNSFVQFSCDGGRLGSFVQIPERILRSRLHARRSAASRVKGAPATAWRNSSRMKSLGQSHEPAAVSRAGSPTVRRRQRITVS
jgi:hypothetical protein